MVALGVWQWSPSLVWSHICSIYTIYYIYYDCVFAIFCTHFASHFQDLFCHLNHLRSQAGWKFASINSPLHKYKGCKIIKIRTGEVFTYEGVQVSRRIYLCQKLINNTNIAWSTHNLKISLLINSQLCFPQQKIILPRMRVGIFEPLLDNIFIISRIGRALN